MKRALATALLHGILAAAASVCVFPLLWMLSASLMPTGEATALPPRWLPSVPTLDHYREILARLRLARAFGSSLLVASLATVLSVGVNSMAGYALAKLRFPGRDRLFSLLLAGMVVPGQVGMLPLFLLLKEIGLVNTYLGVVVPSVASLFGIVLVRQYCLSIPDSLLDAARIDGAGEFRLWWSIVVPACRPVLTTLAIVTFLGAWNDFLWPLVVLADDDRYTLPVALANLAGEHVQDVELMMAGAVLTTLPVVALFAVLQRHYLAGILSGALKG